MTKNNATSDTPACLSGLPDLAALAVTLDTQADELHTLAATLRMLEATGREHVVTRNATIYGRSYDGPVYLTDHYDGERFERTTATTVGWADAHGLGDLRGDERRDDLDGDLHITRDSLWQRVATVTTDADFDVFERIG